MEIGVVRFDEPVKDTSRKIIHIDMDAFFASVEERDHPELKGQPIIIAKHPNLTKGKGVVATANYVARTYGVHSAMSAQKAYELCPKGVFIPGNYEKYREISEKIREIFLNYTDIIEPLSLDEAYLDVTENKKEMKSATLIAQSIQKEVWDSVHLAELRFLSNKVHQSLKKEQKHGKTIVLKVRYSDFETITKRHTLPHYIKDAEEIFFHAQNIWDEIGQIQNGIRLLGITITTLDPLTFENMVLPLWEK